MNSYLTDRRDLSRNGRLVASFAAAFICTLLLTSCARSGSDLDGSADDQSGKYAVDGNGPTILLGYSKEDLKVNPITSFMYFVPLISPTLVDRETSANNEQQIGIVSYKRTVTSRSFYLTCEFEIVGKGFHRNTFDPAGMIRTHAGRLRKGEPLTSMLDYIMFEGEGLGRIEVEGTMAGAEPTVTQISMQFNARGHKSPVTIGLYDVIPEDGQYKYENRSNEAVARVNSLIFKRTKKTPRLGIKVASISDKAQSEGLLSGIKGSIANLFITQPKMARLGNNAMLKFGYALLKQEPSFTFPKAGNIREHKPATIK
jgi:hypothetical protein